MSFQEKPLRPGKGNNPNSRANLVKGRAKLAELRANGVLTNPNGYSLTADVKHKLNEEADFISPTATPHTKLWRDQIARAILVKAALGDVPMVKEVWERVDGKVASGQEGNTYVFNIDQAIIDAGNRLEEALKRLSERVIESKQEDKDATE